MSSLLALGTVFALTAMGIGSSMHAGCGDADHHCFALGGPGCDDASCCTLVCAIDPSCCAQEWDLACVELALEQCATESCIVSCDAGSLLEFEPCGGSTNAGCDGPASSGSTCCFPSGLPTCDDEKCMSFVCSQDPFCCMVAWDQICADLSIELCPELCNVLDPQATALPSGSTLCGAVWADRGLRDVDWYRFTLEEQAEVSFTVLAQTPLTVGISDNDGIDSCTAIASLTPSATTIPCEPLVLTACLEPGVHWLVIEPVLNNGLDCAAASGRYLVTSGVRASSCVLSDPVNETCATAIPIALGATPVSTAFATTEPSADAAVCPALFPTGLRRDIWFRFDAPRTGTLRVQTCGTCTFTARLAAYSGACGELTSLACDDDGDACPFFDPRVHIEAVAGASYYLRLGTSENESGSATLTISYLPCTQPYEVEVVPLVPGYPHAEGRGISSDGEVVGDTDDVGLGNLWHGFRWSDGRDASIMLPTSENIAVNVVTVNASGLAIANREFVFEALGAQTDTFLSFVSASGCATQADAVYDINDANVAVGAIVSGSCSPKPVRWTGLFSGEVLSVPSGATVAVGINAGGDICGNGVPVAGGPKAAWMLVGSQFTWITAPNGFDLDVVDLTDDRTVAGHYALANMTNPPTALFVWKDGVFTTLTPPPEFKSFRAEHIAVVNGATTVLGSATLISTQQQRWFFLWQPGSGMRFLNDIIDPIPDGSLWINARARINGAGAIATTVRIDGVRRAVRLNRRAPSADLDCNGSLDGADLALVLGQWGACVQNDACTADLDVNGVIDAADLAIVLGGWGTRTAP